MPAEPPIPGALWDRLERYRARCRICLRRVPPYHQPQWRHLERIWQATLNEAGRDWPFVQAEHTSLAEAVTRALEEAEALGWDKPREA